MPITIKHLEENIRTLPEDLYDEVNDFVDFLKFKYSSNTIENEVPDWQIEETNKRLKYTSENPISIVSETEMNSYIRTLKDEL